MAVFFAKMVMPRSFSKSLLSMIRSVVAVFLERLDVCWSNLSTKVVLPCHMSDEGNIAKF